MNTRFHSVHYCSSTKCSALNELPRLYCVQFARPNDAEHAEVVGDTKNSMVLAGQAFIQYSSVPRLITFWLS